MVWLSFISWVIVKCVSFLNKTPDKITRHLNSRKRILNMSGISDRHSLYLNKIKVYSSLTTAIQTLLSYKSRVLLNITFSGPKIQNHINSISMCQVLIVSKIWCCCPGGLSATTVSCIELSQFHSYTSPPWLPEA